MLLSEPTSESLGGDRVRKFGNDAPGMVGH
jgi:hypothetical protein